MRHKPSAAVELNDLVRIREARCIPETTQRICALIDVFRSLGHEIADFSPSERNKSVGVLSSLIGMYSRIASKQYGYSIFPEEPAFAPQNEQTSQQAGNTDKAA